MLIQFSMSNFRSFRNPAVFSMKASSGKELPDNIINTERMELLKSAAIFGANAAGKTNIIRAIASAIMIIRTSDMRQINDKIPFIDQFMFSHDKAAETSFEFDFLTNGKRYIYGFSCTKERITQEYLTAYYSQKPSEIFRRENHKYSFSNTGVKNELEPLTERNTPNKLFLATATSWNARSTKEPYIWFSTCIDVFDSDNPMIQSLSLYEADKGGELRSFTQKLLKEADINISDYAIRSKKVAAPPVISMGVPFLSKEYAVMSQHDIKEGDGNISTYYLPMQNESKGTQNLFFMSPQIKKALDNGYVFCVDELDSSMHPALLLYIVGLFNNPDTNPHGAQLIMTSHTTEILSTNVMRRDQIFFVEKNNDTGISELYSLDEFSARTREDIRKAYLAGRFGAVPNII